MQCFFDPSYVRQNRADTCVTEALVRSHAHATRDQNLAVVNGLDHRVVTVQGFGMCAMRLSMFVPVMFPDKLVVIGFGTGFPRRDHILHYGKYVKILRPSKMGGDRC